MTLFNPTVRFSPALLSRGIKPFQKNIDIIENLYSVFCPRGRHRVQRACPVSVVDIGKERYSSMTGLKLGIGSDDMVSQNNKVAMDPFSSSSTIFSPQVFQKILQSCKWLQDASSGISLWPFFLYSQFGSISSSSVLMIPNFILSWGKTQSFVLPKRSKMFSISFVLIPQHFEIYARRRNGILTKSYLHAIIPSAGLDTYVTRYLTVYDIPYLRALV